MSQIALSKGVSSEVSKEILNSIFQVTRDSIDSPGEQDDDVFSYESTSMYVCSAYAAMFDSGIKLSAEELDALYQEIMRFLKIPVVADGLRWVKKNDGDGFGVWPQLWPVSNLLLSHALLERDEESFKRVVEMSEKFISADLLQKLLGGEAPMGKLDKIELDRDKALHIIEHAGNLENVAERLATNEHLLDEPKIRKYLISSNSPGVAARLIVTKTTAGEFQRLLAILTAGPESFLLWALEEEALIEKLDDQSIQLLLQSSSRAIRIKVLEKIARKEGDARRAGKAKAARSTR